MTVVSLPQITSKPREYWFPAPACGLIENCETSLRNRSLQETETLASACLSRCGITRVADVTDLDILGIPVFHSIRPDAAPGLNTVTSGKGMTSDAARVSAMMEAIERTYCEPPSAELPRHSYAELRNAELAVLDPRRLTLRRGCAWSEAAPISWWPVRELLTDAEVLVPALSVFTPYPAEHGMFRSNTIGLAIGNNPQEALLHSLLEVIEHDCTAFGETLRRGGKIRLDSLPASQAELVVRFQRKGVNVQLFGYYHELGVPTVFATTDDTHAQDGMLINGGAGCHLDPVIAATRALTEAAQSRLSVIGGAREDLNRQAYRRHASYSAMKEMLRIWSADRPEMDFGDLPNATTGSIEGDLSRILAKLRQTGLSLVFGVELAPEDLPFSVTKAIVPGLEVHHEDPARLGVRLHRELVREGRARPLT